MVLLNSQILAHSDNQDSLPKFLLCTFFQHVVPMILSTTTVVLPLLVQSPALTGHHWQTILCMGTNGCGVGYLVICQIWQMYTLSEWIVDDYRQLDQQNEYHHSCPPNPFIVLNHDSTELSSLPYLVCCSLSTITPTTSTSQTEMNKFGLLKIQKATTLGEVIELHILDTAW